MCQLLPELVALRQLGQNARRYANDKTAEYVNHAGSLVEDVSRGSLDHADIPVQLVTMAVISRGIWANPGLGRS